MFINGMLNLLGVISFFSPLVEPQVMRKVESATRMIPFFLCLGNSGIFGSNNPREWALRTKRLLISIKPFGPSRYLKVLNVANILLTAIGI